MLIRGRTLLKASLLGSLCIVAASCQLLEFSESGDELTFVNRADRPFAPIILDAKELPLFLPFPWLTAAEFQKREIEVASSAEVEETDGYEKGDNLAVFLYAPCECNSGVESSIMTCPDKVPYAKLITVPATELVQHNYRVIVNEVPAPACVTED
jgi:hypothetical protein